MADKKTVIKQSQGPFGFAYFLAIIGSAVYFIQQVDGFWLIVLAVLKAFVWPAFLTYDLFEYLNT